jgi:NAD(P)-dependent dehydrogenase (short-subunit alcohol dehydrogenase family)
VRARNVQAVVLSGDLAVEADVVRLVPEAAAALGPLGVLVNNASTFERDEWHDASRASWDAHIEPNLRAPFVLTQAFAQALPAQCKGVVVNLLDERVWSLTPHFMSYTLSKAGLWALTQTMALALAPRIRVAGIGPGPTVPSPRQTQAQFERQCASVPLGHGTSPEEVAAGVLAILALRSYTGQMMALDGGQHMQWSPAGSSALEE